MDNTNMAQGLSFAEDMKRLEELKKNFEMTQSMPDLGSIPDLQMPDMGVSPQDLSLMGAGNSQAAPQMDRDAMLQQYKDNLMQKIAKSEETLGKASEDFSKSQEAGSGWKGGLSKGLAVFGDTLSAMGGGQGGYTKGVMGQISQEKKEGADKYKTALESHKGTIGELDKMEERELRGMSLKEKKDSMDPTSQESEAARIFAKSQLGVDLPENTNAIQAKVYIDQFLKKKNMDVDQFWKKENFAQRERGIEAQKAKDAAKPTRFQEEVAKKEAKTYADTQESIKKTATNLSKVDEAINAQLDYSSSTLAGTGPIATMGGAKKYFSQDLENLDARYKDISLNKMVSMFSGMSKAVDSDAERRAFEATTASIKNDDKTNLQILLGSKSSLLKDKAVAEAQADWADQYGSLKGFEQANPILKGEVTTLVDSSGEMQLVPKSAVPQLKKQGLMSVDDYVNQLAKSKFKKGNVQSQGSAGGSPWEKYRR